MKASIKHLEELTAQIKELELEIEYLQFRATKLAREYQAQVLELLKDDPLFSNLKPD